MRAVIFDLDGVLVHTDKYHYQAWKRLAQEEQLAFDEEKNNRLRGISRMESLEIVLEESSRQYTSREKEVLAEKKNRWYQELLVQMTDTDVTQEVKDTLAALLESGLLLAIGSSSRNAQLILKQTGIGHFFHAVSDGNGIRKSKPNPEVFLNAAKLLQTAPKDCCVVEDAYAGIAAAKAAGMQAIGMGDAKGCPQADDTIEHFSDILSIITK